MPFTVSELNAVITLPLLIPSFTRTTVFFPNIYFVCVPYRLGLISETPLEIISAILSCVKPLSATLAAPCSVTSIAVFLQLTFLLDLVMTFPTKKDRVRQEEY